jgi:lipoprotein NlpD
VAAPGSSVAPKPAPARTPDERPQFYTVKPGDTLYSIALDHGVDYRELASWNGLDNPGALRVGQQLRVVAPASGVVTAPLKTAGDSVEAKPLTGAPVQAAPVSPGTSGLAASAAAGAGAIVSEPKGVRLPYSDQAFAQLMKPEPVSSPRAETKSNESRAETKASEPRGDYRASEPRAEQKADNAPDATRSAQDVTWAWPVKGKIVGSFNGTTSKGIDIAGRRGQPVTASAAGRVIFSGTGVRGMGKFVVIKHNETFISVYAHNDELMVKYGQNVARGQKIAEMGSSDTDQVKLHFEIRRRGTPVDPLKLLPDEPA